MKKLILALTVVTVLASCGGNSSTTETTCDTCTVKVDSIKAVVDTTKTVDTTKVVDTTKKGK